MYKIVHVETIRGLLTVDIVGRLQHTVIGNTIKDDKNNQYILQSVALYGGVCDNEIQTLVLSPKCVVSSIGDYIVE